MSIVKCEIGDIPRGYGDEINLQPKKDPLNRHTIDVSSSSASTVSLSNNVMLLKIIAEDYGVYIKRLTSTDTDACTSSNFHDYIPAGSICYHPLKEDAINISIIGKNGVSNLTIIEY